MKHKMLFMVHDGTGMCYQGECHTRETFLVNVNGSAFSRHNTTQTGISLSDF